MTVRFVVSALAGAALMAVPLHDARASDLGKIAVGVAGAAVVGCIVTGRCTNNNGRSQAQAAPRSGVSQAQRQQNREVQAALNTFGFNAGVVDGALGQNSRRAIGDYQAFMGFPRSGYLDDYQRSVLVNGHQRYNAGGAAAYPQVLANEGTRGLLKAFQDPTYAQRYAPQQPQYGNAGNYGVQPDQTVQNPDVPALPNATTARRVQTPTAPADHGGGVLNESPAPAAAVAGGFQPLDLGLGQAPTSMAARCEVVTLVTQTNQAPIQASNLTNADQALSEKFCEARSFAISVSQGIAANVRAPEDQIAAICEQIGTQMAPAIGASASGPEAVSAQAAEITTALGLSDPTAAKTHGELCLGIGYRLDDAEVALGGAALMLGTGNYVYSEVFGHHLREGFGVAANVDQAVPFYRRGLQALDEGAQPAFLPSQNASRAAVIRAALDHGSLRAGAEVPLPQVVPAASFQPLQIAQ